MSTKWEELSPAPWQQRLPAGEHWDRKLAQARSIPPGGLLLGSNLTNSLPVFLTPNILSTHLEVIGATGTGKSFIMEAILKTLILLGFGVTVLDPHGDLYERILAFCAWLSPRRPDLRLDRRVVPLDFAETRRVMGFNPIARNARVMTYQVVALMESIRKCFGQANFQETPRLARWLFNVAYALVSGNLTFIQAQHLVDPAPNPMRTAITNRIENPRIRAEWEFFETMKLERREEKIESTLNRIKPFVEHEVIRPMLGQYTKTLDFSAVLSERKILLVNLARQNVISEDNQNLLGTLLVNELLTAAFSKSPLERVPHYLAIDEFSRFTNKDACEILDGGRKFKIHLILAHQNLNQLKQKDPEVYYSTLTNARSKIVFGGLNDEDVELISKELFTGEFDPDQVKDEIWHRGFEPVESTRTVRGYSSSEGSGESSGSVNHSSLASGEVWIPGSDFWAMPTLSSTSRTSNGGSSRSHASQYSSSSGMTETTVPFYEFHEYRELTSRAFRSLEEQVYLKKAQLKRQPNQHAAVLIPGQEVHFIKVATLRDLPVTAAQCDEFRLRCIEAAGCYKSPEQAHAELTALEQKLLAEAKPPVTVTTDQHDGEKIGPPKAPIPIWTPTTAPGSDRDRSSDTPHRGGAKRAH
jgi:hypothetical protein